VHIEPSPCEIDWNLVTVCHGNLLGICWFGFVDTLKRTPSPPSKMRRRLYLHRVSTRAANTAVRSSGVATAHGGTGGRVPPLVPRTDCGIRPDPMRSWKDWWGVPL